MRHRSDLTHCKCKPCHAAYMREMRRHGFSRSRAWTKQISIFGPQFVLNCQTWKNYEAFGGQWVPSIAQNDLAESDGFNQKQY